MYGFSLKTYNVVKSQWCPENTSSFALSNWKAKAQDWSRKILGTIIWQWILPITMSGVKREWAPEGQCLLLQFTPARARPRAPKLRKESRANCKGAAELSTSSPVNCDRICFPPSVPKRLTYRTHGVNEPLVSKENIYFHICSELRWKCSVQLHDPTRN